MRGLPWTGAVAALVGAAALAIASAPLAAFLIQYYQGGLSASVGEEGGRLVVVIYYNITVPLKDFKAELEALAPGGEAVASASAEAPLLEAGDRVVLSLDESSLAGAGELRLTIAGSIAGLYGFNASILAPIGG
ncbi:hypothetical protein [Stetteria hydrogenophila]